MADRTEDKVSIWKHQLSFRAPYNCRINCARNLNVINPATKDPNGHPENHDKHTLIAHSSAIEYPDAPHMFDELSEWLAPKNIGGLVFHHPDDLPRLNRRGLSTILKSLSPALISH